MVSHTMMLTKELGRGTRKFVDFGGVEECTSERRGKKEEGMQKCPGSCGWNVNL